MVECTLGWINYSCKGAKWLGGCTLLYLSLTYRMLSMLTSTCTGPPPLIIPHNPSQKFNEPKGSMTPWSRSWESEREAKYKIQKWLQIRWQWLFSAQETQVILDGLYPCRIRRHIIIWRTMSSMVGSLFLINNKIINPPDIMLSFRKVFKVVKWKLLDIKWLSTFIIKINPGVPVIWFTCNFY